MKYARKSTAIVLLACLLALMLTTLTACGGEKPVPTETIVLPEGSASPQAEPDPQSSAAPESTEAPAQSAAPQAGEAVADSFFDDAVFVGDSVSVKLQLYVAKKRASDPNYLGKAQFLVSGSLGSGNALWEISDKSVHPTFDSQKVYVEDGIAKTGAKKVYIMLGLNDIVPCGIDGSIANMGKLIDRILEKTPDAAIYVQSATPITRGGEKTKLNNKALAEYDAKLEQFCTEKGYHFVDVASVLRDGEGYLPDNYSSDNYVHLTDEACEIWIDYLRTHTV